MPKKTKNSRLIMLDAPRGGLQITIKIKTCRVYYNDINNFNIYEVLSYMDLRPKFH